MEAVISHSSRSWRRVPGPGPSPGPGAECSGLGLSLGLAPGAQAWSWAWRRVPGLATRWRAEPGKPSRRLSGQLGLILLTWGEQWGMAGQARHLARPQ